MQVKECRRDSYEITRQVRRFRSLKDRINQGDYPKVGGYGMTKLLRCQRGYAMVVSMAAIVILGIFSVALLAASSSTYQMQANNRHRMQGPSDSRGGVLRKYIVS